MPSEPTPTTTTWTIGSLLTWTRGHFEKNGVDDPRLCAELLLAKAIGCKRIELYTRFEQSPTEAQRALYRDLVRAAAAHEPIAYLIGTKEFYSLEFAVTPDVLIPRPETELLVERTLVWCKEHPAERYDLLDVGTGSGCIAITLAKRLPAARVVGCDISEAALAVATANASRHGVADRVRFVRADLLDVPAGARPEGGFDAIVSNPPYIAETDAATLPENVRKYEPGVALFAGADGLSMYRRMAEGAAEVMKPGGFLAVEVGFEQADAVEGLFKAAGLTVLDRRRDAGGIERALAFTLSA